MSNYEAVKVVSVLPGDVLVLTLMPGQYMTDQEEAELAKKFREFLPGVAFMVLPAGADLIHLSKEKGEIPDGT